MPAVMDTWVRPIDTDWEVQTGPANHWNHFCHPQGCCQERDGKAGAVARDMLEHHQGARHTETSTEHAREGEMGEKA